MPVKSELEQGAEQDWPLSVPGDAQVLGQGAWLAMVVGGSVVHRDTAGWISDHNNSAVDA